MKHIKIPFRAKDSENNGWEYTIPAGMEAVIEDGKVIVRKKENKDEKIRKSLLFLCDEWEKERKTIPIKEDVKEIKEWLEKQKEQKPAEWSKEDELMRTAVIQTLERFGGRGTTGMQIDWLKSLRPQPRGYRRGLCLPEKRRQVCLPE